MAEKMQRLHMEGTPDGREYPAIVRGPLAALKVGCRELGPQPRPKGKVSWELIHLPSGSSPGYGRVFGRFYGSPDEARTVLEALLPTTDWMGLDRVLLGCSLKNRGWGDICFWNRVPTPEDILEWCGRQPGILGPLP